MDVSTLTYTQFVQENPAAVGNIGQMWLCTGDDDSIVVVSMYVGNDPSWQVVKVGGGLLPGGASGSPEGIRYVEVDVRDSPLRVPLMIVGGDDPILDVHVFEAGVTQDLTGTAVTWTVADARTYEILLQRTNAQSDLVQDEVAFPFPVLGNFQILVPGSVTSAWRGAYHHDCKIVVSGATTTLFHGVLNVIRTTY